MLGERVVEVLADTHPCLQEKVPQEGLPFIDHLCLHNIWSREHKNLFMKGG